jgi:crotonobetainyl-CoA:carnitine CoA-transferase CaiB-like acyl-CoA transferase
VDVPDSSGSSQRQIASPFKFSSCKPEYRHTGVELGEQTDMVLKELGYSLKQINELKKAGVCEDYKTS